MNRAHPRFRNEGADFDILRRQQYDNWLSGGDPLALSKKCVVNQTGLRSRLFLLIKIPFRLRQTLSILIASRARAVEILLGRWTGAQKSFLTGIFRFGQDQLGLGLVARRSLRGLVQAKKRIASLDLLSALDSERFQGPGQRGTDINELAFDVALKAVVWRLAATRGKQNHQPCSKDVAQRS